MKGERVSLIFPLALVFYEIGTYLANDMYLPSLPAIGKDLHISQKMTQYTLLTWFLGSASMQLLMGPLADRFGRKVIVLMGALLFILSSFVCAYTSDITLMLIARFIQGSAVCSVVVAGYAAIHELYDTKTAIKVMGIMGAVTILAPAFGPLIGALIIKYGHWRDIFIVLGTWGVVASLILFIVMPETMKHHVPLNIKAILSDYVSITLRKEFLVFMIPFCLIFVSFIGWIVDSPFLIIEQHHLSAVIYGLLQLLVFGCFILGTLLTRLLIYRLTPEEVSYIGLSIASMGALFLWAAFVAFPESLTLIVLFMSIISFGSAVCFGPLNRLAVDACHEPMGRRIAISSTFMNTFGVLATFLVTVMDMIILIISSVLASLLIFFVLKRKPSRQVREG